MRGRGRADVFSWWLVHILFSEPLPAFNLKLPLTHCRIQDGKYTGVAFSDGGKGRVEGCHIRDNALVGVCIGNCCRAILKDCKCGSKGVPALLAACTLKLERHHPRPTPSVAHVQDGLHRPLAPTDPYVGSSSSYSPLSTPLLSSPPPPSTPAESARTHTASCV